MPLRLCACRAIAFRRRLAFVPSYLFGIHHQMTAPLIVNPFAITGDNTGARAVKAGANNTIIINFDAIGQYPTQTPVAAAQPAATDTGCRFQQRPVTKSAATCEE
ncbi:MAG: hypothetical protein PHT33_03315 [bacterium]|nr:hypothetical protein [bacterium]